MTSLSLHVLGDPEVSLRTTGMYLRLIAYAYEDQ